MGLLLQLLLRARQPLHPAHLYRCVGRGLCGDVRDPVDVFHRRPAWHLLRSAGFAARTSAAHPALFRQPAPFVAVGSTRTAFRLPSRARTRSTPRFLSAPQTPTGRLMLIFWSTLNLSSAGLAPDPPIDRLVCCPRRAVSASDASLPYANSRRTMTPVSSEAAASRPPPFRLERSANPINVVCGLVSHIHIICACRVVCSCL
jgi:hypothetical protein